MDTKLLKDLLQSRMTFQLSLFFKATVENNELDKEKITAVIQEINKIAKSLDIEISSTISGSYGENSIDINFD